MQVVLSQEIAAQRIAELHQGASRQRMIHELRARGRPRGASSPRSGPIWDRLRFRRPRPARA
jgi:hypothetical protein